MLKIVACILMLVDHIGAALFPSIPVFRVIGRLAMPLFAYMIARGYKATSEHGTTRRYVIGLAVLFVSSQIPHFLTNGFFQLNIVASWLISILALKILEEKRDFNSYCILAFIIVFLSSGFLEYDFLAIAFVVLYYYTRVKKEKPLTGFLGTLGLLVFYIALTDNPIQANAIYAVPLLDLIRWLEKKYPKLDVRLPRYAVYLFYPIHLYILGILKILSN